MGTPILVTLSSVGTSRAVNLDWAAGKPVSFSVTGSSSGTFSYTVEGALDDLMQVASTGVAWLALSSGATTTNSSINSFTGPVAGLRVNATALSSAILTLRVIQGIGW
jgi:hypothetical protein